MTAEQAVQTRYFNGFSDRSFSVSSQSLASMFSFLNNANDLRSLAKTIFDSDKSITLDDNKPLNDCFITISLFNNSIKLIVIACEVNKVCRPEIGTS